MSDTNPNFHEFALRSSLFKGRADWYFCYLKAEKIAHVLTVLADSATEERGASLRKLVAQAGECPESVARLAADELSQESVLADLFSLISAVRLAGAAGDLSPENALLIGQEYERLAQKLDVRGRPSPFVSSEDFSVPRLQRGVEREGGLFIPGTSAASPVIKDTKGQTKGQDKGQNVHHEQKNQAIRAESPGRQERVRHILEVVRAKQGASIKEISSIVKDCGEKTIQRELAALIEEGLVRKEGERRWSIYKPVSGIDRNPPIR